MIDNVKEYDVDCNYDYDFFAQRKEDFYNKFSHKSVLCQGKHWKKPPLVTILITTYKRPELLRHALLSALNQKGFEDYQVIIADNEGRPVEEETLTAKVVKEYQDEKIIYYRHDREVLFRECAAARLARSQWIVFLHDDDLLAENHLKTLTDVVEKYKDIRFLSCEIRDFATERDVEKVSAEKGTDGKLYEYLRDTIYLGPWSGWLGALISRKHYIAIGGMPSIVMGMGDTAFAAVFLHHFGIYKYRGGKPLYFYRRGEQQATFLSIRDPRPRINEYFFYKYVINKYHRLTHKIWERNMAYALLNDPNAVIYNVNLDVDYIISKCGISSDIREKNVKYYLTKLYVSLYRHCIWHLEYIYRQKIKKSDIYAVI